MVDGFVFASVVVVRNASPGGKGLPFPEPLLKSKGLGFLILSVIFLSNEGIRISGNFAIGFKNGWRLPEFPLNLFFSGFFLSTTNLDCVEDSSSSGVVVEGVPLVGKENNGLDGASSFLSSSSYFFWSSISILRIVYSYCVIFS